MELRCTIPPSGDADEWLPSEIVRLLGKRRMTGKQPERGDKGFQPVLANHRHKVFYGKKLRHSQGASEPGIPHRRGRRFSGNAVRAKDNPEVQRPGFARLAAPPSAASASAVAFAAPRLSGINLLHYKREGLLRWRRYSVGEGAKDGQVVVAVDIGFIEQDGARQARGLDRLQAGGNRRRGIDAHGARDPDAGKELVELRRQ